MNTPSQADSSAVANQLARLITVAKCWNGILRCGSMVVLLHGKGAGKIRMPAEGEAAITNVTTVEWTYAGQTREMPATAITDAGG
jgi:hypothetical protein